MILDENNEAISNSMFYDTLNDWGGACLTSVVIPDSVTTIEKGMFGICEYLTSINIPNSVTYIGDYAFESCKSLSEIICNAPTALKIYVDTFYRIKRWYLKST